MELGLPISQDSILTFEHAPPWSRLIIRESQEVKYSVDQKKTHFAPQRMTHPFCLKCSLVDVDGDVPFNFRAPCPVPRIVTKGNDVGCAVHTSETAVQFLDPFMPGNVNGELDRAAHLLQHEYVSGQALEIMRVVGTWRNPSGFKYGDVDQVGMGFQLPASRDIRCARDK